MPTIEEVESDILIIIAGLSSSVSAINNAVKVVGIQDTKQFEKGINNHILRFENLRTKVRALNKLRSKLKSKKKNKIAQEETNRVLCLECGRSLTGEAFRCPECNEMVHLSCLDSHRLTSHKCENIIVDTRVRLDGG